MENLEKKVFLICPVRDATKKEKESLNRYVTELESKGYGVHYPEKNTVQNYLFGFNICSQNRTAIERADEVHIYFNPTSAGSFFDIGMAFMAGKSIHIINKNDFDQEKSDEITLFLLKYSDNTSINKQSKFYEKMLKRKEKVKESKLVKYELKEKTIDFLFDFGMAFMAKKDIKLINRKDVKSTYHKSFENVLLVLDGKYRRKNGKFRNLL